MEKIKWGLKQLFPLTYRSHYSCGGDQHFAVWKMWGGKVYDHENYKIIK